MKVRTLFLASVSLALVNTACVKDTSGDSNKITSFSELTVPNDFNYQTSKTVSYNIKAVSNWSKEKILLEIYDGLPLAGGEIITATFLDGFARAQGEIQIPSAQNKLYAVVRYPDGSSSMTAITGVEDLYQFDFSIKTAPARKLAAISPDCNTGCANNITGGGNYNINGNQPSGVYCLTNSFTGKNINVNRAGVTIRLCGIVNLDKINLNSGSDMEITDGSVLNIKQINLNQSASLLTIYNATVTFKDNMNLSGNLVNHGTLIAKKAFHINGSASVVNNGSMDIKKDLHANSGLINNSEILVEEDLKLNSGSAVINNCKIIVGDKLHVNKSWTNSGYVSVGYRTYFNGNSTTTLNDNAMLETEKAEINATINGAGINKALVKVNTETTINGGGNLMGNLDFCDLNGIETNYGSMANSVSQSCSTYIPTSPCNPAGNGSVQISDSDQDGVADAVDKFPNDPTLSGISYYPSEHNFATLAFEDLWPKKGDYDFNDLVIGYQHSLLTNATNMVVKMESKFVIQAIGGSYRNGFGFQLDLIRSQVASVTGTDITDNVVSIGPNGTEDNQNKATIIVFDNAQNTANFASGFMNTVKGNSTIGQDTITVITTFIAPQQASNIGSMPLNPFLIINRERGKELHLINEMPTDLANTNYFGTDEDASNIGTNSFYKTQLNHPWAINIITDFDHPAENNDIVTSYNYFTRWAQSGGSLSPDWYMDNPGHRNSAKLY